MQSLRIPRQIPRLFWQVSLFLGVFTPALEIKGQCPNRITANSGGVQQFSCTEVTVTSDGSVAYSNIGCNNIIPYHVAVFEEGSFTFTFCPPVAGITMDFEGFDNEEFSGNGHDELSIEINGSPYFIPDAGSPSFCNPNHAIVTPGGNLMCPNCGVSGPCRGGAVGVQIDETISSIRITDFYTAGNQAGVLFSISFCCGPCGAYAGTLTSPALQLCPNIPATVPPASKPCLPSGTLLQYVLYSDPNDILGSIVLISNSPSFSFDPAIMQTGQTYYIAAIAGDNLNSNVDLNDDCLSVSNAIEVLWWPWPSVDFSMDNTDLCIGDCATINVAFTGEPPFTLTYSISFTSPTIETFQENTGTIVVCAPSNSPPGNISIQAIKLIDENCTCN